MLISSSSQLQADHQTKKVGAVSGPPFCIQRTLLASISKELADELYPGSDGICRLEATTYEALRIFFSWILRFPIRSRSQELLAQSWRFGARYQIPAYQNEVMRCLVDVLHTEPVKMSVVRDAYVYTTDMEPRIARRIKKREHLLRNAFVTQLASDTRDECYWKDEECEYVEIGLAENHDFHKDLCHPVCFGPSGNTSTETAGACIEELLVHEPKR
jgi:hypothetical protein